MSVNQPATSGRTTRRRPNSFASPRMIRLLADVVLLVGILAAVGGVVYAINGATQAGGYVEVPVLAGGATLEIAGQTPNGAKASILVTQDSTIGALPLTIPSVDKGHTLSAAADGLTLSSFDSTVPEQLLSRGDRAVQGLCLLVGALLLFRLLISIAEGKPFRRGNAGRAGWNSPVHRTHSLPPTPPSPSTCI